jgi:hypothetical protein
MIGRDVLGRNFFGRELSLKLTLPSSSAIKVRADSGTEKTLRGDVVRDVYLRPLTGREDSANLSISWSDAEKHTDKGVLTGFVGKRFVFAPKETIK